MTIGGWFESMTRGKDVTNLAKTMDEYKKMDEKTTTTTPTTTTTKVDARQSSPQSPLSPSSPLPPSQLASFFPQPHEVQEERVGKFFTLIRNWKPQSDVWIFN